MDEVWIEKIENYLNGTMSREEQLRFKAELTENEELASVFNLFKEIEEVQNNRKYSQQDALLRSSLQQLNIKYFGTQENMKRAGQNRAEQFQVTPWADRPAIPATADVPATGKGYGNAIKMRGWKKLTIAAILIGVVAMGTIWFLLKQQDDLAVSLNERKTDTQSNIGKPDTSSFKTNVPPKNTAKPDEIKIPQQQDGQNMPAQVKPQRIERQRLEALYAVYSKPDVLPDQKADALEEGDNSYKNGAYKEAIAGYESVIMSMDIKVRGQKQEEKQTAFHAYYYRAQSYLSIDSVAKAIPDLNKAVKNTPDSYWKIKAQWYLGLAHLKIGEVEKAAVLLKQVANNNQAGEYRQKATELLRILDHKEKTK